MSTTTSPRSLDAQSPADVGSGTPRHRRLLVAAAGLAGAWLLPFVTHLVGIDLILPPLLLLGVMSLVQGGRNVVDQFVVAVSVLFGVLCLAALGISAWPWGLHPVPVAGLAFSALVTTAVLTGRRPRLRWRFSTGDWLVVGAAVLFAALVLRQFVKRDLAGRLALLAPGEDFARHFIVYDAIGQAGGYTFMHRPEVARFMEIGYGLENYPQGLHFLYALLGTFLRSSTGTPGGAAAMNLLIWCHVATFLFFGLAVLWAVRRVGGEAMRKPKAFVVLGAVVAYLFFGDPVTILLRGFPNELAALALVAILVALLARPLHRMGEQLVTLAALLVGIGFTYYLYLPVSGLLCLVWLVVYRRRVRPRLWVTGAAALFALGAFVPMVVNPKANRPQQLLLQGGVIKVDQQIMLALVLAVAGGLLVRGVLRSWAWRAEALALLLTAGLTAAIYAYQVAVLGSSIYYYVKACHVLLVVALVGTGALGRLLPDIPPPAVGRRRRIAALLPGTALVLAVCALFGALNGPDHSSAGGSYGMGLLRGKEGVTPTGLRVAVWATNTRPDPAGWAVVDLSHGVWANFYSTLYGSVMQRNYRTTVAWYVFMLPQGQRRSIADLEHEVDYAGVPVRFLVGDPKARFLVLDSGRSPAQTPGGEIDTGDPGAMTNIEAAEYLAAKFPGRVEIVHVGS